MLSYFNIELCFLRTIHTFDLKPENQVDIPVCILDTASLVLIVFLAEHKSCFQGLFSSGLDFVWCIFEIQVVQCPQLHTMEVD